MNSEQWKRVRAAFEEALCLDQTQRAEFLASLRSSDGELAASVEELLERDTESGSGAQPDDSWTGLFGPAVLAPGTRLGAYEIVTEIASGGMGTVYRAERADDEYRKSVAIKLIKRGMDSTEILERFRLERQLLADLEHPGIARLLHGGASEDGQPYFVMEYVEGKPIDEWCDAPGLSMSARVELFQKVCQAVHYAHQHLVVHRDLKPSNILVTAAGEPKLLDFGVARLLDLDRDQEHSRLTAEQGFLGTPSYASPEQLRGERATTATDVYSLGVVLYRILTGEAPFQLSGTTREEARRLVCESEPTKPSTSLAMSREGRQVRGAASQLAGDLDNIVLMALRKEPERRYASAEQLAEDIGRYLDGLPVMARPNTVGYLAGKFFRRNRASTLIGAALVVSLMVGIVTSTRLYFEASEANEVAVQRFEDVRSLAATFIFDVSGDIGPLEGAVQARERIVRSALEYLDQLAQDSDGDPRLLVDLASAYLRLGDLQGGVLSSNLGQRDEARISYEKAYSMAHALREEDPDSQAYAELVARCLYRQADLDHMGGERHEARERLDQALALCPADSSREDVLNTRAESLLRIGDHLVEDGEASEAAAPYTELLEITEGLSLRDPDSVEHRRSLAVAYSKLAMVRLAESDREQAMLLGLKGCQELESLLENEAEDSESRQLYVAGLLGLGRTYFRSGRLEDALEPLHEADEQALLILESDPRNELVLRNRSIGLQLLGYVLTKLDRHEDSLGALKEANRVAAELLEANPESLHSRRFLAVNSTTIAGVLTQLERLEESLEYNQLARVEIEALLEEDPGRAETRRDLAVCLTNIGAYHMGAAKDEARPLPKREEHAGEAAESFEGALDQLLRLQEEGKLARVDQGHPAMLRRFVGDAQTLGVELQSIAADDIE